MVRNVRKDGTFSVYSCLFTMSLFESWEIVSGNDAFQEL